MRKVLFVVLVSLFFTGIAYPQSADQVTVTTYYPAPYGEYVQLKLTPQASLGNTCNNEGAMYYNNTANQIYYCDGTNWRPIGGADLGAYNGSVYGNGDPNPINTGVRVSDYPNAVAVLRGASQYDKDRRFWVHVNENNGRWYVDVDGDINGDGGDKTRVYFTMFYWR